MFWRKAKFLSFECIYFKGTDQYKHARDSQKATFLSIVCSRSEKNEREMWSLKMLFSFVKLRQVWLPSSQDLTSSHVYIIPSQWQFIIKWVHWSFTSRKFKSKFKTIKQQWHSQSSYNPASNLCAAPQRAIVRATEKKNCFLAPFKMNSELYRQRKSEMPRPCNKMGSNLAGYCSDLTFLSVSQQFVHSSEHWVLSNTAGMQCEKNRGGLSSQRVHTNPPFIIWKKKHWFLLSTCCLAENMSAFCISVSNVILTSTAHPTFVQHSKTQYYFRSNSSECSDTAGLPGLAYSDLTL